MKRRMFIKFTVFVLIFIYLFCTVQDVVRYKWENHEFISTRLQHYSDEEKDTIDVLFFGSSPIYAGISPIIMWDDIGASGMNFGTSLQNAVCNYYQLEYAIQKQTPKVVVMDFAALFEDRKADEVAYEATYRKIAETMPDRQIQKRLIENIVQDNENQDKLSYYFPLLRYHERWKEITKTDFVPVEWYKDYFKGGLLNNVKVSIQPREEWYYNMSEVGISDYSQEYYKKIIETCQNKGIIVVAVTPPNMERDYNAARFDKLKEFCNEQGIDYINYNDEENLEDLALDFEQDFYDTGHMSINGSLKLTKDLGEKLKELYDLPDHRGDIRYDEWNRQWEKFAKAYDETLLQVGYFEH